MLQSGYTREVGVISVHAEYAFGNHKYRFVSVDIFLQQFLQLIQIQMRVTLETGFALTQHLGDGVMDQAIGEYQVPR